MSVARRLSGISAATLPGENGPHDRGLLARRLDRCHRAYGRAASHRGMEAAGDRWWPISGGVYFLHAIKRMHGMRIIKPGWKNCLDTRERIVSATRKLNKISIEEQSSNNLNKLMN